MKTIKIFSVLLVLFSSISCDRDDDLSKNFDPTKYYLTGEIMNGAFPNSSYVLGFQPNAIGYFIRLGGLSSTSVSYSYTNNVLKVEELNFNIADGKVVSSSSPAFKSCFLQKIPDKDAFDGKTFKGTVTTNGVDNGKSGWVNFTGGKFAVKIDGFTQTGTGAEYTLQNNGVATATTGNEGRRHLLTIGDGKLYYSQFNAATNTHYFGVLNEL